MEKRIISYNVAQPYDGLPTGNPLPIATGEIANKFTIAIPDEKVLDAECISLGKDGAGILFTVENAGVFNYREISISSLLAQRYDVVQEYKDQLTASGYTALADNVVESFTDWDIDASFNQLNVYAEAAKNFTKDLRKRLSSTENTLLELQYAINFEIDIMKNYTIGNSVRKVVNGEFYNSSKSGMTPVFESLMQDGAARASSGLGAFESPDGSFITFFKSGYGIGPLIDYTSAGKANALKAIEDRLNEATAKQAEGYAKAYEMPKERK